MADVILDTYKLEQYAQRLGKVNRRISTLDRRLNGLYTQVGLRDLFKLIQADALTGFSWRLLRCQNYLNQTAGDFKALEKMLADMDIEDFHLTSGGLIPGVPAAPIPPAVDEQLEKIKEVLHSVGSGGTNILESFFDDLKEDVDTAGEALSWLEEKYESIPREARGVINILGKELLPDSLEDAYKLTSGLIQGDLTREEFYDVMGGITSKNAYVNAVVEVFDYTFTTGKERGEEMDAAILEQAKEGDILGVLMEGTEGFVDTILAGSVECLFGVGGNMIDGVLGDVPIVGSVLNETTKYITGKVTGGEEYTIGQLFGLAGKKTGEFIDGATDVITDVTDVVTSGLTKGVKAVGSWIGSWF